MSASGGSFPRWRSASNSSSSSSSIQPRHRVSRPSRSGGLSGGELLKTPSDRRVQPLPGWEGLGTSVGLVGAVVVRIRDELDAAVGVAGDGLAGQVEAGVVVAAEHDQVVKGGGAAAAPVVAVVAVAPDGGDVAAGVLAVA